MAKPIKVNYYRSICEFTTGGSLWHLLRDGRSVLLIKDSDIVCMNEEKQFYSVIKPKRINAMAIDKKEVHLFMLHSSGNVTVIKRKLEENGNKKDAAKI